MSSASIREPASFGKRKEPHTIVVMRDGKSRQFTINPALFSVLAGTLFMFLFGYFGATAYLIFRDDLISASYTKQARMQHEYEDRIAALRSKLDRVTSRQLLDQRAIEIQVRELMGRQERIGGRSGQMINLVEEARKRGMESTAGAIPVPVANPSKPPIDSSIDTITTGSVSPALGNSAALGLQTPENDQKPPKTSAFNTTMSNRFTQDLFAGVSEAIGLIDAKQRHEVGRLRIAAAKRTTKIESVLKSIGVPVQADTGSNVGGPFVSFDHTVEFETHLDALEQSLKAYDSVSKVAKTMPLGSPLPNSKVSSRFGSRIDPFNGRMAMHNGIDFKAKKGTPVKASGAGVVTSAGRKGGYGKVVEIRHSNGYTTRYAHLSRINFKKGQKVRKGQVVGKVGSTGRSTGPHLHYEVRRNDKARNPSKYIKAGYEIRGLL